ncbi:hypothetical protein OO012_01800 [Rhodobacteraceae bacterium KMM 6894]|nr:hypothetical protein [Rhodobacteraceae bacterium KMM 6894]
MSAPDTNIETQEKRHKGPLSGMFIGVMVAGVMFLGLMIWLVWNGNDPGEDTPAAAESTTDTGTVPLVEPVTTD